MAAENPDAVFASVNLTFWSITLKSVEKKSKKIAVDERLKMI